MVVKSLTLLSLLLVAPSALAAADLTTTLTASPSTAQVYATARYTATVRNIGNKSASNATVQIALPATHTSPQVYVLGILGARSASCALAGTTLTCTLGTINRNASKSVFVDLALPVSAAPIALGATAATTSAENSTANNSATLTASQTYFATPIAAAPGAPALMRQRHCTGTGLTAFYECTLFPSSLSFHDAEFHDDGTITVPGYPDFGGGWTLTATPTGSQLDFFYDDGTGVVAEFSGWGADAACFEGLTTFPGSAYVSPYEVCPL